MYSTHTYIIVMFQNGLYSNSSWMVNEKPGTGDTPIERLLSMIFSLWYLGSILPVIMAQRSGSSTAMQWAILAPLFYHILVTINFYLFGDGWKAINKQRASSVKIAAIHAFLTAVCLVLYQTSHE